jgi:hypothetical protein
VIQAIEVRLHRFNAPGALSGAMQRAPPEGQ